MLSECCRESQAEVANKHSNKIHQTWGPPFSQALYHNRNRKRCSHNLTKSVQVGTISRQASSSEFHIVKIKTVKISAIPPTAVTTHSVSERGPLLSVCISAEIIHQKQESGIMNCRQVSQLSMVCKGSIHFQNTLAEIGQGIGGILKNLKFSKHQSACKDFIQSALGRLGEMSFGGEFVIQHITRLSTHQHSSNLHTLLVLWN